MRAAIPFLAASALINALLLHTLERTAVRYETSAAALQAKASAKKAAENGGPIAFEYVEAPKAPPKRHAAKTSRISERDAVNQGRAENQAAAEGAPLAKAGPTNQLAQKKGNASPALPASPEVRPQSAQGPSPPQRAQKAQEARPAAKPGEGSDRITTDEMSRLRSRGARLEGLTSFEATGSGMGVYMKNLKEKIWLAWFPYLITRYPADFKTADAVVSFTLNARGEVKIVELIDSKGSALFAAFCMEAIQRAGSFGPLPPEILALVGKDELEIKFAFHYK
jgi:hypothetical protein